MQSKSLLIAIAAFAVTTTGAQAYSGTNILDRAGLSEGQKSALVQAHELKVLGKVDQARDVLVDAGIDEQTLLAIHHAKSQVRADISVALALGDFELFTEAIVNTPLAEIITTETDFAQFKEAHEYKMAGDVMAAQAILSELGIERHAGHHKKPGFIFSQLSDSQREALVVARQANDNETVRAILHEAGL